VSAKGAGRYGFSIQNWKFINHPYFTQDGEDREENPNQYIANFRNGSKAGFKYFDIDNLKEIEVKIRGKATGKIIVLDSIYGAPVAEIDIKPIGEWMIFKAPINIKNGKQSLYFTFQGKGHFDFMSFVLKK
jgi:arabinoxylan arabinofuranohydrolase